MPGHLSSGEREFGTLIHQLRALEDEIGAARRASSAREARTLADGAQILIRPIEPEDVRELAAGFDRLGALSRFRLLGARVDNFTRYELAELARVDHDSSDMLVALDASSGKGIGP